MGDFVQTRASKTRVNATEGFLAVNHEAHKKQSNKKKLTEKGTVDSCVDEDADTRKKRDEREMKRARHEVIKFGMSGFEKSKALEAKIALAVSLGAKPPKKKRKNYSELKQERAEEREASKREAPSSGLSNSLLKRKAAKGQTRRQLKEGDGILGVYGRVNKTVIKKIKR